MTFESGTTKVKTKQMHSIKYKGFDFSFNFSRWNCYSISTPLSKQRWLMLQTILPLAVVDVHNFVFAWRQPLCLWQDKRSKQILYIKIYCTCRLWSRVLIYFKKFQSLEYLLKHRTGGLWVGPKFSWLMKERRRITTAHTNYLRKLSHLKHSPRFLLLHNISWRERSTVNV